MNILGWIVLFTLVSGALGAAAAGGVVILPEAVVRRLLPRLVSFAIGALLGAAFLGLLPHAVGGVGLQVAHRVLMVVLIGILVFFLLEKMVLWRHCHSAHCDAHEHDTEEIRRTSTGVLILVGDGVHNFVDGVLIAAAFLTDVHLGIVTSVAVLAHELPQELGDVAILLRGGFSRGRAVALNILSSLTTVVGGVAAYFSLAAVQNMVPYVLAVAAASFIYIALSDLIPDLHRDTSASKTAEQMALIVFGIALIGVVHLTVH